MKIYVTVPVDVNRIKSKILFNLTKRQILCFGCGIVVGVPLYFICKDTLGSSAAVMVMMVTMLPAFLFAMYEKNGQTLEVRLRHIYDSMYRRPKLRLYKMKKDDKTKDKEVKSHDASVFLQTGKTGNHGAGNDSH